MDEMPEIELRESDALSSYAALAAALPVNGVANLRHLLNEGLRLFRSEAEGLAAGSAMRHVVRLEPSDSLLEILLAIRAGDPDLSKFVLAWERAAHDDVSLFDREKPIS
jgi:hypothetical protein